MAITDPLRLPSDVVLVPVAELAPEVRRQLRYDEGDFAITRPRVRTPSRIVDAQAAELLREFAEPRTIVEAVIRFARACGADPETTLDDAFPLLERLLAAGFLVAEGAADADGIVASLVRGERAGRWEVVETIQLLEDSEIHLVRDAAGGLGGAAAALKIERQRGRPALAAALAHEAAVLAALGAAPPAEAAPAVSPRLLEHGEHEGRRFLAIEWCSGVTADAAAGELRQAARPGSAGEASQPAARAGLAALCRDIAGAYARLHARGMVHGDVHPRNVLVGPEGEVRLIDFGLAVPLGAVDGTHRGGVGFFFEPEYAAAVRAAGARAIPAASPAGEQYAVAALLYWLVAGAHYLDFSLEREELFRQIAEEPPLPFAGRGIPPWLELEAILARALAKEPAARFPSLAALTDALAALATLAGIAATAPIPASEGTEARRGTRAAAASPARTLLATVLAEVDLGGALWRGEMTPPAASIFFGAGGIACGLYRLALQRDDARLFALADLWLTRAERSAGAPGAFLNPEMELTEAAVGTVSPYHTASGLAALRALVAQAQGDLQRAGDSAAQFTRLALSPIAPEGSAGEAGARQLPPGTESPDLTLGRSGVLLVAALLADVLPDGAAEREQLAELGRRALTDLWRELDRLPPIAVQEIPPNLGISHGWAGYAYAALRFCRAFGAERPAGLTARLAELAAAAEPTGRGLRWPWNSPRGDAGAMPGWCNGSAGFVYLWTLAHRELGEPQLLALATGAAWNAWEGTDGGGNLCCGAAGRAYALAHLSNHLGGESRWLERARALADRAAVSIDTTSEKADSLFKGRLGVAVLAADLESPRSAALPFFAEEGWRAGA